MYKQHCGMIVMFIFNNYTMNLCCLWADGQWLNEAQPSELTMIVSCLIVLAQQKAGFVTLHWLVYTKYLSDMLAHHQLYGTDELWNSYPQLLMVAWYN